MHLYGDFDENELLEENLLKELGWLSSEFEILFGPKKGNYSSSDIKLAHNIIETFIDQLTSLDNKRILELISETLNELESKYVNLFDK